MGKSVIGADNLIRKLNSLGGNSEEILRKSMTIQGKLIQAEAKLMCPVDNGALRNSIQAETRVDKGTISTTVSTNNEYAAYVEFGTGKKGQDTSVSDKYPGPLSYKQDKWKVNIPDVGVRWVEGQPAQPFMYPALKNNEDRVIKNVTNAIKKSIEEVCKK